MKKIEKLDNKPAIGPAMKFFIRKINNKQHACFKKGNQIFIIHTFTGKLKDAKFQKEMLEKAFSTCPRCDNKDYTTNGDTKYCGQCGSVWWVYYFKT